MKKLGQQIQWYSEHEV